MRLHVVDGTYELFRAHFSKRPDHTTPEGQPFKATAGLISSLLGLLHDEVEAVTHIGVAFDNPIRSFRNDRFAGYKTGEGVPAELLAQFDAVEEAVRSLGVVVWSMDRWEADDALATAAVKWASEFEQIRILTPDKDLAQAVRSDRVVQVDRSRRTVRDEEGVREKFGVGPTSIPDFLALVGDTADGIPGLPGFGKKTAATLLAAYEHLEEIPDVAEAWSVSVRGAAKLAKTLSQSRALAGLYKELATLVTDVPLPERVADLHFRGVPRERFHSFCDRFGLSRIKSRPRRWR